MKNNNRQLWVFDCVLKQSTTITHISSVLSLIGLFLLLILFLFGFNTLICSGMLIVCLVGIIEKYYAIRVAFDRDLFRCIINDEEHALAQMLSDMDNQLYRLKLIRHNNRQYSLDERQNGTYRLLKRQLLCCLVQLMLLLLPFFLVIVFK